MQLQVFCAMTFLGLVILLLIKKSCQAPIIKEKYEYVLFKTVIQWDVAYVVVINRVI